MVLHVLLSKQHEIHQHIGFHALKLPQPVDSSVYSKFLGCERNVTAHNM